MHIYFNQSGLSDFNEKNKAELIKNCPLATFSFSPNINYNATMIVSYPSFLNQVFLDSFPRLKYIHLLSTGYDELNIQYLKSRNIRLFNASDTSSESIAELVIGQIINVNYNLSLYKELQSQKIWHRHLNSIELSSAKALILGTGALGQAIAQKLNAFGVEVSGLRRSPVTAPQFKHIYTEVDEVKAMLHTFDYVIITLTLSDETRNMVDMSWFTKMKMTALLVNVARGPIIVEDDLIIALTTEQIRGAILDVTAKEPLPMTSPLWELKNVFLTPHIAFYSNKYLAQVLGLVTSNIDALVQNKEIKTEVYL